MIVIDTSAVVAFMNRGDESHDAVRDLIEGSEEDLVTSPLAVAEMDHLVARMGGAPAATALRADLAAGAYQVEWWGDALAESLAIAAEHDSLGIGLTDASLVALAGRMGTTRVATLDEGHFRRVAPLSGEPAFELLPADR
ncbi:MAG: PIN domain-containing protein [Thermoleophilaceae bacterium]|nr:PIN domain-containing protein [Thermoleophilaceae bacterium]